MVFKSALENTFTRVYIREHIYKSVDANRTAHRHRGRYVKEHSVKNKDGVLTPRELRAMEAVMPKNLAVLGNFFLQIFLSQTEMTLMFSVLRRTDRQTDRHTHTHTQHTHAHAHAYTHNIQYTHINTHTRTHTHRGSIATTHTHTHNTRT